MKQNYRDRMMNARDPRFAKIAERLGYNRRDMVSEKEPVKKVDEMDELRARYLRVVGKRPFNGWDADALRAKIAEAESK